MRDKLAGKHNLTLKGHFKVIYFSVNEKQRMNYTCILQCTYSGLIRKGSEDIVTERSENCRFRRPHSYLAPLSSVTPREYPHKPH